MFYNKLVKEILKAFLKLILAGVMIGLLHQHDLIIAILLGIYIVWKLNVEILKKSQQNLILLFGMLSTSLIGVIVEKWGIYNHFWTYQNLSAGRDFPYWLPFAWALAFYLMYKLERVLITYFNPKSLNQKFVIFILVSMIFPVVGEMITINLGVWVYAWPYQILGVPFYAILYLVLLHMFVNSIFLMICFQYKIKDPVFSFLKFNA